jgi:hypothetical protein
LLPPLASSASTLPALSQAVNLSPAASSGDPFPYFSKFATGPNGDNRETSYVTDLELMHHYSTVTCLTLPRGNEVSHIWQIEMVKVALTHEPALHAVLATAAFHLAYMNPKRRRIYTMVGSQHQSDAARGLRTGLTVTTPVTQEDSLACFAAASLLVICAFAAHAIHKEDDDRPSPTLESMIDLFILTRGMNAVLQSSEPGIHKGRFADLFKLGTYNTPMVYLEAICGRLHDLSLHLTNEQADRTSALIAEREVHNLIKCIRGSIESAPIPELRVAMTWPIYISDDFVMLLNQKNQMALTVFIYYCAIVHESGSQTWYTTGWGFNVAADVEKYLTSPWRETARWPFDCMGIHLEASQVTRRPKASEE